MDSEKLDKVIKGLECAIGIRGRKNCDDCPYDNDFNCVGCDIVMRDAIALLKEQEAVKPEIERSGSGVTWWNVCGNCKTAINPNDKFCHECGRSVKWE